jgi:DNA-binding transcriptional regulator YiaG
MRKKQCPICGHNAVYKQVDGAHDFECLECCLVGVSAHTKNYASKKWYRIQESITGKIRANLEYNSRKHYNKRKANSNRKFSAIEVNAIKREYLGGLLMRELAVKYGVSKACIQQMIRGKQTYKELA